LTDAQVDAVASYVWVLSHQAIQPSPWRNHDALLWRVSVQLHCSPAILLPV